MADDLDISKFWEKLAQVIKYDIQPAAVAAAKIKASGRVNGYTEIFASGKYTMEALRSIQVTLSLEALAPLVKLDLTVAERLMQQFMVVKIVSHECLLREA